MTEPNKTDQKAENPDPKAPAPAPRSRSAAIECTVKKTFYNDNMQLVMEGKTYYYQPVAGQPFPFNILQPNDDALAKELEAEYREFKAEKLAAIREQRNDVNALRRLARA